MVTLNKERASSQKIQLSEEQIKDIFELDAKAVVPNQYDLAAFLEDFDQETINAKND
jgi:hypothetical protein